MPNRKRLTGLALMAALVSTTAHAAPISGKKDLICANSQVVACVDGKCMEGPPQTFDLMTFIFIDVSRKIVHGVDEDGNEAESPIRNVDVTENSVILQGMENHQGWTIGIDRNDKSLNMSLTGPDIAFIVAGNCIER